MAWVVMLLISPLPNILLRELAHLTPSWILWVKTGILSAAVLLSIFWKKIRPLWQFFVVILALYLVELGSSWLGNSALWRGWFGGKDMNFVRSMFSTQLLRLGVTVVMVLIMLILKRNFRSFYLVKGDISATGAPIRWLGVTREFRWNRFGTIAAVCISLGTLVFLVISGKPTLSTVGRMLPYLPAVLLFALINSFSEEMNYRASLLSTLEKPLGGMHAVTLLAVFFGLEHFYGVPYGVVGVVMATLLGWLLGKSMVETRGFFWAWFIHFWQDVFIFSFMAIGAVTAGGL